MLEIIWKTTRSVEMNTFIREIDNRNLKSMLEFVEIEYDVLS